MKWLCASLIVLFIAGSATAGEDPYIVIVNNDALAVAQFYFGPKYIQFFYDQETLGVPVCFGA